eukprot:6224922-Alexandrium_andersonii.AAC.1
MSSTAGRAGAAPAVGAPPAGHAAARNRWLRRAVGSDPPPRRLCLRRIGDGIHGLARRCAESSLDGRCICRLVERGLDGRPVDRRSR